MHIYDFEKNRNKIKIELTSRLIKSDEKLNSIKKDYRKNNNYEENEFYKDNKDMFEMEEVKYTFAHIKNKTLEQEIEIKECEDEYKRNAVLKEKFKQDNEEKFQENKEL